MLGGLLQIGSGLFSGYGAADANAENKGTKKELDARIGSLRGVADPIRDSLVEGWSPGGFLRKATTAQGQGQAAGRYNTETTTAKNNAWRFGGRGSGRFLGGMERAKNNRFLREADAANAADLQSLDQLERIFSSIEGANNVFPVELAANPYAGISQGMQQFGAQLSADNVL